ncbi:MAG TPA: ArsB/NhaD family transporter, partial [Beutenbergiaceae bacterium]|nr:ArsB/NhaD family transporter [Beutenbergiaceae bacterium]
WMLVVLVAGYFLADPLGVPVSAVALAAGGVLAVVAARPTTRAGGRIAVGKVIAGGPWQVVIFSLGMYLVVYGLRNQGLTDHLGSLFAAFADHGTVAASAGTGVVVAGLSSLMNNLPTTLIAALGVEAAGAGAAMQELMALAAVIGADLGPKITPIGSLATLLWLDVLRRRGMDIGWGTYFKVGIVLTLPVLLITLLALAGWVAIVG